METKYFNISEYSTESSKGTIASTSFEELKEGIKKACETQFNGELLALDFDAYDENDEIDLNLVISRGLQTFRIDMKIDGLQENFEMLMSQTWIYGEKIQPKRYFLFGASPSNEYHSRNKVEDVDTDHSFDGVLYVFDPATDDIGQFLVDYDGWGGYAELSKEEYDHLESKLEPKEVPVMGAFDENGDLI